MVGLVIAHFGVTLFLLAELGSDPFNVLIQGLYRFLSSATGSSFLTHGRIHIIVCLLIIIVLLIIDRSYIKIGTVLCMICGGPIIDFFTMLLSPAGMICGGPIIDFFTMLLAPAGIQNAAVAVRILILMAGCVILAYGMTIVIKSDAGTGPNDLVAIVISDKTHKNFSIVRIIVDLCFVLIGWLLKGTVGIGTVICAFLVGPVAGIFLPINGRLVDRIVGRKS